MDSANWNFDKKKTKIMKNARARESEREVSNFGI